MVMIPHSLRFHNLVFLSLSPYCSVFNYLIDIRLCSSRILFCIDQYLAGVDCALDVSPISDFLQQSPLEIGD